MVALGLNCGTWDICCGMQTSSLRHVDSVAACMWDLVPQPGLEPGPPALGAWSITHWTTREVPPFYHLLAVLLYLSVFSCEI